MPGIEAIVELGDVQYTFEDILKEFTHVRGFGLASSYCICELAHTQHEIMNQFMNYGTFRIRYGSDDDYIDWTDMQLVHVTNTFEFSRTRVKVIGMEPGFVKLGERNRIRSYPDSSVSDVFARLAFENDITGRNVIPTQGRFTFIQPNVSDLTFLTKYMLPLATTSAGDAPYLFTIDQNTLHLHAPNLGQDPLEEYIIDFSIDNIVKRFSIMNNGIVSDFSYGSEYRNYGYDFISNGLLQDVNFIANVNPTLLNNFAYSSNFNMTEVMPYEQKWMVDAHNNNNLGQAAFMVQAEAVMEGSIDFNFDQIYRYTIPLDTGQSAEYSGKYYVYSVAQVLKPRLFLTHLKLRSNSFSRGLQIGDVNT